jgi:hypothetical protein
VVAVVTLDDIVPDPPSARDAEPVIKNEAPSPFTMLAIICCLAMLELREWLRQHWPGAGRAEGES